VITLVLVLAISAIVAIAYIFGSQNPAGIPGTPRNDLFRGFWLGILLPVVFAVFGKIPIDMSALRELAELLPGLGGES
jgi:hypothetical protein